LVLVDPNLVVEDLHLSVKKLTLAVGNKTFQSTTPLLPPHQLFYCYVMLRDVTTDTQVSVTKSKRPFLLLERTNLSPARRSGAW